MPTGMRTLTARLRRASGVSVMAHVIGLRALALGVNLCTGLVTAGALGPDGRGEQAALTVTPQFLAAIATLGLHASLIYNIKADPEQERRYLGCALLLAAAAGIVITLVGWVLLPHWLNKYTAQTVHVARLLVLLTPLGVLTPLLTGTLEAHAQFGRANRMLYLQSLGTLVALGGLWAEGWLTPTNAAMAYLLPSLPAFAYFAWYVFRLVVPRLTMRWQIASRLLRYGLRFYGVDLLGSLAGYLDQIVVVALLPNTGVGIYVVALSLSRVLTVLQGAVSSVLFPSIAARTAASVIETVALTVRVTTTANAAAAIGLGLAGPYALQLLYGDHFLGAVLPFRILLVETIVSNAARILYQVFNGTGRPGVVTVIEGICVAVSLGTMLLLVPRFGIEGAAISGLLASVLRLISVLVALTAVLKVHIPRLILLPSDVMALVAR